MTNSSPSTTINPARQQDPLDNSLHETRGGSDGKWRRLIHDPTTGHLLDLGHTSYQPSAPLTRYIHARDQSCAFPTCNRPAHNTDLDHTKPYQPHHPDGGTTNRGNLGTLCRTHHRLKHETPWTLRRDPTTTHATWTSITGHQYPATPHDHTPYNDHDLPPEPEPWNDPAQATPDDLKIPHHWYLAPAMDQLNDPIAPLSDLPYDDQYALA